MSEKAQNQDRLGRDSERSTEAHWRAAEEAAEGEPTQKTPTGLEIPVRECKDVEEHTQPEKKP